MSLNENTSKIEQLLNTIADLPEAGGGGSGGNVDLTGYATEQYVQDYAQPKGNYLTEHQDISGKLDASALPSAIDTALAQAKASGEFDGKDGADGYTPVKGVDYWTDADQESVVQQVIAALGTPVFGRVDADKVITLTGELVDGTYTFQYEDKDGNVHPLGSYTKAPEPTYTNLFVPETCTLNTRNNSSGATSPINGCFVTDFIDLGDAMASGGTNVLHYKGMYFKVASGDNVGSGYSFITYYKADKSFLGQDKTRAQAEQQTADGDYIKTLNANYTAARYIRVTAVLEPYTSDTHTYAALTSKDQLANCKIALNETITD